MILYPLIIAAVAVLVTLIYASFLDIRDRRVPFRTWMPMLAVGIPATLWLLYDTTGNFSLMAGYLALVAGFFYVNWLDTRDEDEPVRFFYLGIVLSLPAISWFGLVKTVSFSLVPLYAIYAGILCYVTYAEYQKTKAKTAKQKKKQQQSYISEVLCRWYFVPVIVIFAIASFFMVAEGGWGLQGIFIVLAAFFCGVFYLFGQMHLFGGADAWALIFISFCIPTFPMTPLLNSSPLGFLSFSVLINALILNLAAPVAIFFINVLKGNRAPFPYMFFGFPVSGEKIKDSWGFVMEDFSESKGTISRKFVGFFDSLGRMYSGKGRIYTKDLREHPESFTKELALYKKAGTVWISYAVPFIIPITFGLVTAIVFGDFLYAVMRILIGA